eukprot:TRINITY_DN20715_c0_g1_i1.p1 TRINITY_DN20715_c0_g1~~TRINITY_DN20715_c0_g1_i1.p1  ORF type:complete len:826 (-),score=136.92 TRINITY_DN20715_c0_g1_i1:57-2534(-)
MPLPWGSERPRFPKTLISKPQDKAITLRQLRDLRQFLQRLCKMGLLKFPQDAFNKQRLRAGERIQWTRINQHDIVATVIKQIIPSGKNSCSWVEMLANGRPQTRRFFCSHNWNEPFRDFMASIDHHTRNQRVAPDDSYWICVYANNQWDIELGVHLEDSPFYEALKHAESTMLMLDKSVEALQRVWVIFEMTETYKLKQRLEAWTALGRVGSSQVASGPFVEALANVRTEDARATNLCDQRQLMNRIAGIAEMTGIIIADDQKELDPAAPFGTYEDQLVDKYGDTFHKWDSDLSQMAKQSFEDFACTRAGGQDLIPDPSLRGITLAQLRALHQEFQGHLAAFVSRSVINKQVFGPTYVSEGAATLEELKDLWIIPRTLRKQCSYVELVAFGGQRPEYHVTYERNIEFKAFMEALEWHAEARELPDTTPYWIDILAENHHRDAGEPFEPGSTVYVDIVTHVIKDQVAGLVLLIDDARSCLTVGSNLYEMHLAIEASKSVDLLSSSGVIATTRPFPEGTWMHGEFDASLAENFIDFDLLNAKFASTAGRNKVMNSIATDSDNTSSETEPPASCWEYVLFNQRFRHNFAGPVLRNAAYAGNLKLMEAVAKHAPLLERNSQHLQGHLGETDLHCAAAAGHIEVVQHLLAQGSNPDVQDREGETPLHYAAFCGHAEVAKLLVLHKANPSKESFSAEWPFEVAELNPAYFLGVDTSEVLDVLQRSMAERAREHKCIIASLQGRGSTVQLHDQKAEVAESTRCYAEVSRSFCQAGIHALNKKQLSELLRSLGFDDPDRILGLMKGTPDVDIQELLEWIFSLKAAGADGLVRT